MARFYGVKLADTLSCPSTESPLERYTYDALCAELDSSVTKRTPWIPLRNNQLREVVAVQLLRPLQGTVADRFVNQWPRDYESWQSWITNRLDTLLRVLLTKYPMVEYHAHEVNQIVVNTIVGAYLSETPYHKYLDFLFVRETLFQDIINSAMIVPGLLICRPINYFQLSPGPKYYAFSNYSGSSYDPCLFGKETSNYAVGYYFQNYDVMPSPSSLFTMPSTVLVHYDRPSAIPHYLIPSAGIGVDIYGQIGDAYTLIMLESIIQQFRNNANANPAKPFNRLDECYAVFTGSLYEQEGSSSWRIAQLAVAATNGYQLTERVPTFPTNGWVSTLLSQIRAPGYNPLVISSNPRFIPILYDSPSPLPEAIPQWYVRINVNSGLDVANVHVIDNSATPVQLLLQYSVNNISIAAARVAYDTKSTLPITPEYHNFWTGGALMHATRAVQADADVNTTQFPPMPPNYFDRDEIRSRGIFSSYRGVEDRSLLKDTANLIYVYSQYGLTGERYLQPNESVAYFGASGAHQPKPEPTIISKWKEGSIPTVPAAARIRQIGYDTTLGQIADLRFPVPIGTFTYVYSDVDQVVNGGNDQNAANRTAMELLETCLQCTSIRGSMTMKVNFPDGIHFGRMIRALATNFESYAITKPMVSNNMEVYIHGFSKLQNGPQRSPKASSVVFMREIRSRYMVVSRACNRLPLRGITDRGDYDSGVTQVNIINPQLSVRWADDISAVAGIAMISDGNRLIMSKRKHHGAEMLTLTGTRSRFAVNRNLRMLVAPVPRLDAIVNQVRDIAYADPQVFGNSASLWTAYTLFCNDAVSSVFSDPNASLVDLGTGPEARILSLVPPQKEVTMIDVRPFSESQNCWNVLTDFVVSDYLDPGWEALYRSDQLSCVLSLGAAAASRMLTLSAALDVLLPLITLNGATDILIQLNCPLHGQMNGVRGELTVNAGTKQYEYLTFNRLEPYEDKATIEARFMQEFPNASLTWITATIELPWMEMLWESLMSISTQSIERAGKASQYMPLLYVQKGVVGVDVVGQLRVGSPGQFSVRLTSPQDLFRLSLNGAEVMDWDGNALTSYVGQAAGVLQGNTLTVRWTPTRIGNYVSRVLNPTASVDQLRGSITVSPPNQTLNVTYPAQWDYTLNGTVIQLVVDDFFDLRIFAGAAVNKQLINAEKYTVRVTAQGNRDLTWVVDKSDSMQQFWIQDVQSETPGQYISVLLDQVTTHAWPTDTPLLLSAPDDSLWAVRDNGVAQCILNDPTSQVPATWVPQPVNYGTNAGMQTYEVPPGDYVYVQV
nr:lambdaC [Reptilian orthoreovirus]